ncbi:MAG TPA: LysM peptidoglycan-binding domain-containing protein [Acidimicrobiia bacterium]|jgi:LysM repeat protein
MRRVIAAIACAAMIGACSTGGKHSSSRSQRAVTTTSTTPPTPTTPTTLALRRYQLKLGDTLASVAKRFRVSIAAILFVNHIPDANRVAEGQTLLIPPAPPLALVVKPTQGPPGQAFQLDLTGAQPSEVIVFEIDKPAGTFTGSPHTASEDGAVTATYNTSTTDPAGTYVVKVHGAQGTAAQATFHVVNATTPPS